MGNSPTETDVLSKLTFPWSDIEAALRDELLSTVEQKADLHGIDLPSSQSSISKQAIEIDSLVVVEIVATVEPIAGCELPEKVVRQGGYHSVDEAVKHLLPRIEKVWHKHHGK